MRCAGSLLIQFLSREGDDGLYRMDGYEDGLTRTRIGALGVNLLSELDPVIYVGAEISE